MVTPSFELQAIPYVLRTEKTHGSTEGETPRVRVS
jgi:hypothetical protein